MNVDERVGQNIRKYRMAYNMTLKELAVLLHKRVSTVSRRYFIGYVDICGAVTDLESISAGNYWG